MSDQRPRPGARKAQRGSNDRFQFLRPRSSSRNRSRTQNSRETHSDSESDSEGETTGRHANGSLPSFARSQTPRGAALRGRQDSIEQDAVNTIQANSGNALASDEEYSENEHEADIGLENEPAGETALESQRVSRGSFAASGSSHASSSPTNPARISGNNSPTAATSAEVASDPFNKSYHEEEKDDDDDASFASDEDKVDHFKRFFRRRSSTRRRTSNDSRPSGMRSLKEEDEDNEEHGFLDKFLAYTGGGMTPGLTRSESKKSNPDKEKISGQENLEEPIDSMDISDAAQQILQSHGARLAVGSNHLHPDAHNSLGNNNTGEVGAQLCDSYLETASPSDAETVTPSTQEPFFAPRVGHYDDIDTSEAFDPLMEDESYIAPPMRVRGGVLGSLLKMYQNEDEFASRSQMSLDTTPEPSEYGETESVPLTGVTAIPSTTDTSKKSKKISFSTPFSGMKGKASKMMSNDNLPGGKLPNFKATRPNMKNVKSVAKHANKLRRKQATEAKITVHIAALLQRQRFILRLCKAFMLYGAPTHRLEEYMVMTSRVLEIDGQFLYVPGCMIVSFGDATTRTSEVQLVRCAQGLNLWKLHQVHAVYKRVIHDLVSAEEANVAIDRIMAEKNLYPPWMCVLLYGFCSSMVTPFAFGGDWINMATSFVIGCCVGCLQFIVSQRSNLYSNVFEVTASIVVSFCGRALGSIHPSKAHICFGSTVQGSLALILPGFIILTGSLELQSRNLVAGSVRMFYAIIYSLFLGFGITLGAALFGWIYPGASNETTCGIILSDWYKFIFVPCFSIGLALINQARWSQVPVMTFISCCGYVVTWASGIHFKNSTEFRSAMAAFIIGILGNLYSRIWKGLAVSAMLPGIFVQVPSGIASQSTLLAGVQSANQITQDNGTTIITETGDLSSSMSFGVTMIQVSIGISVGLFASTIFIYPFGKKKTGLFTL